MRNQVDSFWQKKLQPVLRELLVNENSANMPGINIAFGFVGNLFRLSKLPFINDRFAWVDQKKNNVSWLPINEKIDGIENIALPYEVLDHLIVNASHRVIVNFCPCRKAMKCNHYPVEIGCLMMGESALKIPEKTRQEVNVEDAKAHVRKAIDAGLIPITGKGT